MLWTIPKKCCRVYVEGLGSERETELVGVRQPATAQLIIQASMLCYSYKTGKLPTYKIVVFIELFS